MNNQLASWPIESICCNVYLCDVCVPLLLGALEGLARYSVHSVAMALLSYYESPLIFNWCRILEIIFSFSHSKHSVYCDNICIIAFFGSSDIQNSKFRYLLLWKFVSYILKIEVFWTAVLIDTTLELLKICFLPPKKMCSEYLNAVYSFT